MKKLLIVASLIIALNPFNANADSKAKNWNLEIGALTRHNPGILPDSPNRWDPALEFAIYYHIINGEKARFQWWASARLGGYLNQLNTHGVAEVRTGIGLFLGKVSGKHQLGGFLRLNLVGEFLLSNDLPSGGAELSGGIRIQFHFLILETGLVGHLGLREFGIPDREFGLIRRLSWETKISFQF